MEFSDFLIRYIMLIKKKGVDILIFLFAWTSLVLTGTQEHHPGHLKPFGISGPFEVLDEVLGYPSPQGFFRDYVVAMEPLKMINAIMDSPAFMLWSDSYFMSLEPLRKLIVSVENSKIEDRQRPILSMTFEEFLKHYNTSNHYLVTSIPPPISSDIYLPYPLQCPEIYRDMLLANVMWMSSGDTASVVHTDSVDNIICSLRGTKQVVLVDPSKYTKQVVMEHQDEGYSDIDVKKVDYTKYFGLSNVSYYITNITAGDCLFIPFQWIHQVVSFGSNVAINVWWDHYLNDHVDFISCKPEREQPVLLSQVTFRGVSSHFQGFKDELLSHLMGDITAVEFYTIIAETDEKDLPGIPQAALDVLDQMFEIIDSNKNGIITEGDTKKIPNKDWSTIETYYNTFLGIMGNKQSGNIKTEF